MRAFSDAWALITAMRACRPWLTWPRLRPVMPFSSIMNGLAGTSFLNGTMASWVVPDSSRSLMLD